MIKNICGKLIASVVLSDERLFPPKIEDHAKMSTRHFFFVSFNRCDRARKGIQVGKENTAFSVEAMVTKRSYSNKCDKVFRKSLFTKAYLFLLQLGNEIFEGNISPKHEISLDKFIRNNTMKCCIHCYITYEVLLN